MKGRTSYGKEIREGNNNSVHKEREREGNNNKDERGKEKHSEGERKEREIKDYNNKKKVNKGNIEKERNSIKETEKKERKQIEKKEEINIKEKKESIKSNNKRKRESSNNNKEEEIRKERIKNIEKNTKGETENLDIEERIKNFDIEAYMGDNIIRINNFNRNKVSTKGGQVCVKDDEKEYDYIELYKDYSIDFILGWNNILYISNKDLYLSKGYLLDDIKFKNYIKEYIKEIEFKKNKYINSNEKLWEFLYYYLKYDYQKIFGEKINLNVCSRDVVKAINNKYRYINILDMYNVFKSTSDSLEYFYSNEKKLMNNIIEIYIEFENYIKRRDLDMTFVQEKKEIYGNNKEIIKYKAMTNQEIIKELVKYIKEYKSSNVLEEIVEGEMNTFQIIYFTDRIYMRFNDNFADMYLKYLLNKIKSHDERKIKLLEYIKKQFNHNEENINFIKNENGLIMVTVYKFSIYNHYESKSFRIQYNEYNIEFENLDNQLFRFGEKRVMQNIFNDYMNNNSNRYYVTSKYKGQFMISNCSFIKYYKNEEKYKKIRFDLLKENYIMFKNLENEVVEEKKFYLKLNCIVDDDKDYYINNNLDKYSKEKTEKGKTVRIKTNYGCIEMNGLLYYYTNEYERVLYRTDNFILLNKNLSRIKNYNTFTLDRDILVNLIDSKYKNKRYSYNDTIIRWNQNNEIYGFRMCIWGNDYDIIALVLWNYNIYELTFENLLEKELLKIYKNKNNQSIYGNLDSISFDIFNNNKIHNISEEYKKDEEYLEIKKLYENGEYEKIFDYENNMNLIKKIKQLYRIRNISGVDEIIKFYSEIDEGSIELYLISYMLRCNKKLDYNYYVFKFCYDNLVAYESNYNEFEYKMYKKLKQDEEFNEKIWDFYKKLIDRGDDKKIINEYNFEKKIYKRNAMLINILFYGGINMSNKLNNGKNIVKNAFELFIFNSIIIFYEKYYKENSFTNASIKEMWNNNINIRKIFEEIFSEKEIYYKFLDNYDKDRKTYLKKDFIDYLKIVKKETNENIINEINKFTSKDLKYLEYDLDDINGIKDIKMLKGEDIKHIIIIKDIKDILSSVKYKNMYNLYYYILEKEKIESKLLYFLKKNIKKENISNLKNLKLEFKTLSEAKYIKVLGEYNIYQLKNEYLLRKYNERINKKFKGIIKNFDKNNNEKEIIAEYKGKKLIFNKPDNVKSKIYLFIKEYLENNIVEVDNDEDLYEALDIILSEYKLKRNNYINKQNELYEIYKKQLLEFEEYGYYVTE